MTAVATISNREIFVPAGTKVRKKSTRLANAMAIELMNYGIEVSYDVVKRISCLKKAEAHDVCDQILAMYTIGDVNPPLFPGWENRTYFSLGEFVVQLLGYALQISGNDLEDPLFLLSLKATVKFKKVKALTLATDDSAVQRLNELLDSKVALDRSTFATLASLASHFPATNRLFVHSDEARVAVLIGLVDSGWDLGFTLIYLSCKPADVMRYLAARVDIDSVKLPADVKFANVSWQHRLGIVGFLSSFDMDTLCEAMGDNRNAWQRFARHIKLLKQRDFRRRYPSVIVAAHVSRGSTLDQIPSGGPFAAFRRYEKLFAVTDGGNLVYRTFASRVQTSIDAKDFDAFKAEVLARPTWLFRNLATASHVATKKTEGEFVELVQSLVGKASVNVLLSLIQIDVNADYRIIDSKGNTTVTEANYAPVIGEIQRVAERELYRRHGFEGRIEVAKDLRNKVVPFLSTNSELDRGTRIPFEDQPYLYFLIHWIQGAQRTDLDHSYIILDKDWNAETIYFGNQANRFIKQSGDIVSAPAPSGGTEYGRIDLNDIPSGVRYIVPTVNVYCGDLFSENQTAYAGFLFSADPKFSFGRKHVRYDLSQPATCNVPFVIDVQKRELIIVDFNNRMRRGLTAHSDIGDIKKIISALKTKKFMTMQRFADLLSGDEQDVVAKKIVKTAKNPGDIEPDQLHTLVS